jgi:hypothetical protein
LAALAAIRPYAQSLWANVVEIATESLTLLGLVLLSIYIDTDLSDDDQVALGWALVILFSINIFASTILIALQFGLLFKPRSKPIAVVQRVGTPNESKTFAVVLELPEDINAGQGLTEPTKR